MNTITKINLSKLRSCNQVWDDMPENEKGRLCLKCQNTIIDFREMSDAQVAQTHVFSKGKVCGLYKPSQVDSPKQKTTSTRPKSKLVNWYVAACSLLSLSAIAQEEKPTVPTEQTDQKTDSLAPLKENFNRTVDSVKTDSVLVKGKVTDLEGVPIIGANVIIKGTEIGASTDFDGNYTLYSTKTLDSLNQIKLRFSSIGYEDQELILENQSVLNVSLRDGEITEFIVVARRRNFFGRTWQGIKGVFRKKD